MSTTTSALSIGQSVRIHSNYGQCLQGTLTGIGRVNVTIASFGKEPLSRIHTAPCSRCADHGSKCFKVACSCGDIIRECVCNPDQHVTDYRRHSAYRS